MPGPWEKYASQPSTGPWSKYGAAPKPAPEETAMEGFVKNSPIGALQGAADLIRHPVDTISAMGKSNAELAGKAKEAFKKGDYASALFHALNYVLPGGAALDDAGADFANGHIGRGTAKTLGIASTMLAGAKAPQMMEAAGGATDAAALKHGAMVDAVKTAGDPEVARAAIKVIPKGPAAVNAYDLAKSRFQKLRADRLANTPKPPIPERAGPGVPPPLEYEPMAAPVVQGPSSLAELFGINIPEELPSGRKPGGIQNQRSAAKPEPKTGPKQPPMLKYTPPDTPEVTPSGPVGIPAELPSGRRPGGIQNQGSAPSAPQATVPPALDAFAQRAGFPNFAAAPKEIQPLLENSFAAEAERLAQTQQAPVAPQAAPQGKPSPQDIAAQLRDEMMKNGSISEANLSVPEPEAPTSPEGAAAINDLFRELPANAAKPTAKAAYAGDQSPELANTTFTAAARSVKADALANILKEAKITAANAAKMTSEEWANVSKLAKQNAPSKASIAEVLFRLKRLEAGK